MPRYPHRKGLKATKEYRSTARAKKLTERPRGAKGAKPLDAGESASERRKRIRQKVEDATDGSRIESLVLINKEKRIKVSLPEMVDVSTTTRKRNPHRMVIWSQNTPNGRFQLVYLTDKRMLYLASYQGARRDFVAMKSGVVQDLDAALQIGREVQAADEELSRLEKAAKASLPLEPSTVPGQNHDSGQEKPGTGEAPRKVPCGSIDIDTPEGKELSHRQMFPLWMIVRPGFDGPELWDDSCLTLVETNRGLVPYGVNRFKSIDEAENPESI